MKGLTTMAAELGSFKSTLLYDHQGTAAELLADVQAIREFDQRSERQASFYCKMMWGAVVAFFAAIVATIALDSKYAALAVLVALITAIASAWIWRRWAKFDLANRRYELLGALVNLLSRDMPQDGRFTVRADLNPPNQKSKKTTEGLAADWKVTYYVDPWLKMTGRFADGTSFQIVAVEKFQARGKWKRSSSGKNKWKSKSKSATQFGVRLFPKEKNYKNVGAVANNVADLIRLPPWAAVKDVDASSEELSLTTITTENWTVGLNADSPHDAVPLVAMMLLSLYQLLHTSNAVADR